MTSHRTVGDALANPHRKRLSRGPRRILTLIAGLALALNLLMFGPGAAQDDASPTAGTPAATPAADAIRLELDLDELNDSGISGTATLYEAGDQTIVELALEGAGDDHPAHVHAGTCDDLQPEPSWDLANVTGGESSTLIDVSLSDLLNGDYAIDLHLAPNQLGLLIGCANIEGTPVNAEGTPVAAGGEGDETPTAEATETEATNTEEPATEASVTEAAPTEPVATDIPATEAVPTQEPATTEPTATVEPTATLEPTATEASDGTGGMDTIVTPAGDGTDGGKGVPITPTPAPTLVPVGGGSTGGDGTSGDKAGVGSGKGVPVSTTSNLPASTGSGDSLMLPASPMGATIWATGAFALVLMISGLLMRRAETQQRPGRWRRLGL